jgi:hypothetical protein
LEIIGETNAISLLLGCLEEMSGLSRQQKHEVIFQKLLQSTTGITGGGYLDCTYNLGVGLHTKAYGVCHTCFQHAYEIGESQLYDIHKQVKHGWMTSDPGARRAAGSGAGGQSGELKHNPVFVKKLCELAMSRGYSLDKYEVAAMAIPNNSQALTCFAWMDDHFDLVCESEPNCGHMTIEPITIEEVYDEYAMDLGLCKETTVSLTSFRRIWKDCFPHVHRRPYIDCNLKCMTCAALGESRKTHKGMHLRLLLLLLMLQMLLLLLLLMLLLLLLLWML